LAGLDPAIQGSDLEDGLVLDARLDPRIGVRGQGPRMTLGYLTTKPDTPIRRP